MKSGFLRYSLTIAVLLVANAPSRAGAAERQVLKFKNSSKLRIEGKDHLVVLADTSRGRAQRLVVPNQDADGKFDPVEDQAAFVKQLRAGELIIAEWEMAGPAEMVSAIARYSPKPGELTPHGYLFRHTEKASDDAPELTVVFEKLGEIIRAIIPARQGADGIPVADPTFDPVIAKLREGDPVWAEFSSDKQPKLLNLMPWSEPQRGKLVKLEPADMNGQKGMAAQIDNGGAKPVMLLFPGAMQDGKWITDTRLLAGAHRCKPGGEVLYRVQEIDGQKWLREIEPVPQPLAARPTPAQGNGRSNTDANGLPRPRIPGGGTPGVGGVGF